jgi:sugar lactone lactonase YvrE
MKKLNILIFLFLTTFGFSQVTVSTLTPAFKGSGGLSLDDEGNLYIGDFGDFLGMPDPDGLPNDVIQMDTDLNLTQYSTGFIGASGNDFDSNGILYQSDIWDNAIYKIIGGVRTFVTSTGISSPVGIVFDSADNFYVCNCGNGTIQKVTPSGTSTLFASGGEFACPNGITIDENDNLYVSNFSNNNIVKITPAGATSIIGNTAVGNGHLDYDINSGNLYIASYAGQQIYSLNINDLSIGVIAGTGARGNTDGFGFEATFSTPNGIAVSKTGDSIYVNCAVPLAGAEINPQIIRLITGLTFGIDDKTAVNYKHKAYPNPVKNTFTIEANIPFEYENIELKIHNILGSEIVMLKDLSITSSLFEKTIDISNLGAGTYFYSVYHNGRQLFNGKIIKE